MGQHIQVSSAGSRAIEFECNVYHQIHHFSIVKTECLEFQMLEEFIVNANRTLVTDFVRNNINNLLNVMYVLNEIRERHRFVQHLFEPLRKIVDLLLMYGVTLPQAFSTQVTPWTIIYSVFLLEIMTFSVVKFSELPEKWITLRKTAAEVTRKITPIKNYQAEVVIQRITLHTHQLGVFEVSFRKLAVSRLLAFMYSYRF